MVRVIVWRNRVALIFLCPNPLITFGDILGCWVDELPSVLWSINTTPNRSMGYTPFFMVYGAKAVLPSDICHDSPRVAAYIEADNE